jgi:hypothetical protein
MSNDPSSKTWKFLVTKWVQADRKENYLICHIYFSKDKNFRGNQRTKLVLFKEIVIYNGNILADWLKYTSSETLSIFPFLVLIHYSTNLRQQIEKAGFDIRLLSVIVIKAEETSVLKDNC